MSRSRIYLPRLFFAVLFMSALMTPARAFAVIASPDVHVLGQPDGTKFNAVQWGDENRHGWETEDGYTIVLDEPTNRWTYARHDLKGNLAGTSFIAGKDAPPAELQKYLRPMGKPVLNKMTSKEKAFTSPRLSPSGVLSPQGMSAPELIVAPTGTGTNVPVVLINFSDKLTTFSPADFNDLLFGTGNFSMADFYREVSYNKFSVAPGPASLTQWYQAPQTRNYYGTDDFHNVLLVMEAAQQLAADAAGFDFNAYDTDGDCRADVLAVIHQGPGQEATGNVKDIWSHRFSLAEAETYCDTYGCGGQSLHPITTNSVCTTNSGKNVTIDDYIIMPEKFGVGISTIGVFAHEYGHSFGLPDLYDTDYASAGIGMWSLMAAGSWGKVSIPGDRPSHMDAWSKYALGWVTPTKVTTPLTNQPISAASTTADVYQLLNGTPPVLANSVQGSGEYFLVENRQKSGFDAGLPGSGLLIWHIDESQPTNDCATFPFNYQGYWYWLDETSFNPYCTSSSRYHVALVQADNKYQLEGGNCYVSGNYLYCRANTGDAGDPYPGSTNKRLLSGASHPYNNTNLHNWSSSNVIFADISDSAPIMTTSMVAQPLTYIVPLPDALDNPELNLTYLSFTGTWRGQNFITHSGGSAAQSGAISSGTSELVTTITGTASLSFYWKVSSEPVNDYLKVTIDGVEKARISGETRWQQKWFSVNGSGDHTVKWIYVKNGSISKGLDAGWVDNVQVNEFPKVAVTGPAAKSFINAGDLQNITWDAPVAASTYKLYYSLDNGLTWKLIADNVTGNVYPWTTPSLKGNKMTCKVKVVAYTAAGAVVGTGLSGAFAMTTARVEDPNGGESLTSGDALGANFRVGSTVTSVATITLYITTDGGTTWPNTLPVVYTTPGDYLANWTVPTVTSTKTKCKMKVVLRSATGTVLGTDVSDGFFTISPPMI